MAPVEVRGTGGAGGAHVQLPDPGLPEPPGVDALQVHRPFLPPGGDIGRYPGAKGGAHGVGHVVVGLKAARPDTGPDGNPDVLRPGPEEAAHLPHRFGGEIQGGTPPSGVDRPHGPGHRVMEQQDDAVRRKDHQAQPRLARYQGVGGIVHRDCKALSPVSPGDTANRSLVDLL